MPALNINDLNNGKRDLDHIAEIATSESVSSTDRFGRVKPTVKGAINTLKAFNVRGEFVGGTPYAMKDVYLSEGIAYVAVTDHVSSTLDSDLAAGRVTVHQGATREELAASNGTSLIGFLQSGIGAALRFLQDKLRECVTITDYTGVVGNDATNCTDGVRAAIKSNLHVEIPHGTFVFGPTASSGDILLYLGTGGGYQTARDGLIIRGRGEKSILKLADNAGRKTILFGAAAGDRIKGLTIRDLTIDLNGLNNLQTSFNDPLRYNAAAYFFCYCENVTFENVTFLNVSGHQMIRVGDDTAANYGKNIQFKNCRVTNYGIGVPGNKSQDTSVLYIQADGILVVDNVIECDQFAFDPARGHTGFELHGDSSTIVRRNRFKNAQLPWLIASSQKATNNISIAENHYSECFYYGSLDGSYYDQKVIDIGPSEIFNSTKSSAAILRIGNYAEVAKNRENVRFFGNQVMLWGNANEDTHLCDLTDCYIRSLEVFGCNFGGMNGSIVYYAGTVRNSGYCDISVHDNRADSLGSAGGAYPNSPTFLHIEIGNGVINSIIYRNNAMHNSIGKDYSGLGLLKLSGTINYVYVKGNASTVSSAYPLTTGTPTTLFKDIDKPYPAAWQSFGSESNAFIPIETGDVLALYDFAGWAGNDNASFRITVFSTDGSVGNNGITDYDVLVCGSEKVATRLTSAGTYSTDVTVRVSGTKLEIHNANGSKLFLKTMISGNSSRPVVFLI